MRCTSSLHVELCTLSTLQSTSSEETPIQLQIRIFSERDASQADQKHQKNWSWQKGTLSSIYLAILGVDIVSLKINFSYGILGFTEKNKCASWASFTFSLHLSGRGFKAEYSDCCNLKWFTSVLKGHPPLSNAVPDFGSLGRKRQKIKKGEEIWN